MVMAALSPSSVLASPVQVNPQVKLDLQTSAQQAAQDAQKSAKSVQTDTVTISTQALKMADDRNVDAKETGSGSDEQEVLSSAKDKADAVKKETPAQRNAMRAYAAASETA